MTHRLTDIDTLARTLWGEARGEGIVGMEAIANVVMNRVADRRWPNTINGVCKQRWQFSAWNEGDPNRTKLMSVDHSDPQFAQAYAVAAMAVAGMLQDAVAGANHYLAGWLFNGQQRPSWADPDRVTCRIGRHVFLRL